MKYRLLSIASLLACVLCKSSIAAEPRPNVVFIIIDNVDFGYMGKCYGGTSLTPHMDQIAERGVKFTRAYAVTPLCVPSRYTCLSGRYASRAHPTTGADAAEDEEGGQHIALETDLPNVPNVMQKAGYRTGFVGKYHLEPEKYDRFNGDNADVFNPDVDAWLKERSAWLTGRIKQRGFDFVGAPMDFRSSQFSGIDRHHTEASHNLEAEVKGALAFIDESREKPFFLYLSTQLLHLPFKPQLLLADYAKYGRVTEGGLLPEAPKVPMPSRKEIYDTAKAAGATTAQQFGMHWLDCGIGAVVNRLEELKLLDNTLLVVFSDNNQRGKETLYEGGTRVPLLMMWPQRFKAGSVCDHIVANTDFAPTIFDACGIQPPADMTLDGRSILPVLADAKAPWRDALLLENGHTKAVVTDQWKYVALRYPPDVQAKIEEVDRTGEYPRMSPKAEQFFEKFKETLTPEQWKFARNSWRWHTQGNNYMKSIDDFPFQFDPDQLFEINGGIAPQDIKNVANDPANASVLADMKAKLKQVLAPLEQPFGEFGTAYPPAQEPKPLTPKEQRKLQRKMAK
ncbi:MAG: sulfatase-like hydrolase/transferase [Verrucomicrobiaceae bacterium]|nr:sulfatase-like hydrolase/transferase [Verrucomicrobiaceae bacterium]